MKRCGFTLLELLVTLVLIGLLAGLLGSAALRAWRQARQMVAKIEFAHFARTAWYLAEPDPKMIDPETGREMYYTTHPRFTNHVFSIDRW